MWIGPGDPGKVGPNVRGAVVEESLRGEENVIVVVTTVRVVLLRVEIVIMTSVSCSLQTGRVTQKFLIIFQDFVNGIN